MVKKIFANATLQFTMQFANYVFPLVLFPYLTRVLGLHNFGIFIYVLSLIGICTLFIEYGFIYHGARLISINTTDNEFKSELLVDITWGKLLLALFSFAIICIWWVVHGKQAGIDGGTLSFVALGLIGVAINSSWYFIGIQKLSIITIVTFSSKLILLVLIFTVVKTPQQTAIAVGIYSFSLFLTGFACFFLTSHIERMNLLHFRMHAIRDILKTSFPLFALNSGVSLYTTVTPIILASLIGYADAGKYTLLDKIIRASQSLISSISLAAYPYFCNNKVQGRDISSIRNNRIIIIATIFSSIFAYIIVFFNAGHLVNYLFHTNDKIMNQLLRIMAVIIIIGSISGFLCQKNFIAKGKYSTASIIILFCGVTSFPLLFVFTKYYKIYGAAYTGIIVELMILTIFLVTAKYRRQ